MSLAPREKRTVLIGLGLAVIVAGYAWVVKPLAGRLRGASSTTEHLRSQYASARSTINRYDAAKRELKTLTDALHIEVPKVSGSDQITLVKQKFEQLAGRSNVQIRTITELKSQTRPAGTARGGPARGGPARTELKLDLNCQSYAALARFVDSLEQSSVPILVDQMSVTTTGGRGGSGGGGGGEMPGRRRGGPGGQPRRDLQVALKVYTYLFPEKAQQ